jgi:hypothetical protein
MRDQPTGYRDLVSWSYKDTFPFWSRKLAAEIRAAGANRATCFDEAYRADSVPLAELLFDVNQAVINYGDVPVYLVPSLWRPMSGIVLYHISSIAIVMEGPAVRKKLDKLGFDLRYKWDRAKELMKEDIHRKGLNFEKLQPESFDMPMGFKTGAGVIFGNSGGVSEAVLRYAAEKLGGTKLQNPEFPVVRGESGVRFATLAIDGMQLKLAVVHGLKNARDLAEKVRAGECDCDLIEVMACPGGCIGGAGQPVSRRSAETRRSRTQSLYNADKTLELHKSQDNPYISDCYKQTLGEIGGPTAHRLLHTHYQSRRRIIGQELSLGNGNGTGAQKLKVSVCVGTNCFLKSSQTILHGLMQYVEDNTLQNEVDIGGSFCFENCGNGPTVTIGKTVLSRCTLQDALNALEKELKQTAKK